jgi:hypothetical protein
MVPDWYPSIKVMLPIQVDVWFLINDDGEIAQFDMVYRRWRWAIEQVLPYVNYP